MCGEGMFRRDRVKTPLSFNHRGTHAEHAPADAAAYDRELYAKLIRAQSQSSHTVLENRRTR